MEKKRGRGITIQRVGGGKWRDSGGNEVSEERETGKGVSEERGRGEKVKRRGIFMMLYIKPIS